ncbi:MAG: choice-of-anchor tandem repeat NxxGxxAF-containing protein [Planctomycetota bacterium]
MRDIKGLLVVHGRAARSVFALATLLVLLSPRPAIAEFQTVALSGQAAPGAPGRTFEVFNLPLINAAGDVAVHALLDGPNGRPDTNIGGDGIWTTSAGTLGLAVRSGEVAPGTNGAQFRRITSFPKFNALGDIAFSATLDNQPNNTNEGLWANTTGGIDLIVREGEPQPGGGGETFRSTSGNFFIFDSLALNGSGIVAISRGGAQGGVWSTASGTLQDVGISGQFTVGSAPGPLFYRGPLNQNNADTIVGVAGDRDGYDAIVRSISGGPFSAVLETDSPIPGSGIRIRSFNNAVVNDAGVIAYDANPQADSDLGISNVTYVVATTARGVITKRFDPAPGTGGAVFNNTFFPSINAAGDVIFETSITGDSVGSGNDFGLWATDEGTLKLIAREGDPAPGTNSVFSANPGRFTSNYYMNGAGDVIFTADVDGGSQTGLWAYSGATDTLRLILKEGDLFDLDPSPSTEDLREIGINGVSLAFAPPSGGSALQGNSEFALNEAGEFVVRLRFTNGSEGIFKSQVNAIVGLIGDFNENGSVEQGDLNLVLSNWGAARTFEDGVSAFTTANVDQEELNAVLNNWGSSAVPNLQGFDIPEPVALIVALPVVVYLRGRPT